MACLCWKVFFSSLSRPSELFFGFHSRPKRPMRCNGHGGHKISTLEQDEWSEEEKIVFNRCFQWLIKEMKCIMMVMPLHVSLLPRSLMCFFSSLFSPRSLNFSFAFGANVSRICKKVNSSIMQHYSQHCCDSKIWMQVAQENYARHTWDLS